MVITLYTRISILLTSVPSLCLQTTPLINKAEADGMSGWVPVILIPITLLIAFILPGNRVLPMVDLIAIPYMIQTFVCVTNGNIIKSTICGIIWLSVGLLVCTSVAPYFTEVASQAGIEITYTNVMIISFCIMARPLMAVVFFAFLTLNPLIIGLVVVFYFAAYFVIRKFKPQIVDFIERQAALDSAMEAT